MICPSCNYPNPDTSNFCAQCGHPLSAVAAGERDARMRRKLLEDQWRVNDLIKEIEENHPEHNEKQPEQVPYQQIRTSIYVLIGWMSLAFMGIWVAIDLPVHGINLFLLVVLMFMLLFVFSTDYVRQTNGYDRNGIPRYSRLSLLYYLFSTILMLMALRVPWYGPQRLSIYGFAYAMSLAAVHIWSKSGLKRRQDEYAVHLGLLPDDSGTKKRWKQINDLNIDWNGNLIGKVLIAVAIIIFVVLGGVFFSQNQTVAHQNQIVVQNRQQAMQLMLDGDYHEARRYLWPEMEKNNPDELSMHMYRIATAGTEMKYYRLKACTTLKNETEYVVSMQEEETKNALKQIIGNIYDTQLQEGYQYIRRREYSNAYFALEGIPDNYHHLDMPFLYSSAMMWMEKEMTEDEKLHRIIEVWEPLKDADFDNPYIPEDVRMIMKEDALHLKEQYEYYTGHADAITATAKAAEEKKQQEFETNRKKQEEKRQKDELERYGPMSEAMKREAKQLELMPHVGWRKSQVDNNKSILGKPDYELYMPNWSLRDGYSPGYYDYSWHGEKRNTTRFTCKIDEITGIVTEVWCNVDMQYFDIHATNSYLRNETTLKDIATGKWVDEYCSKHKNSGSAISSSSDGKAHGFYGSTDEYEDYDDYMDAYDDWEYRDYDDEDDWEDDWDEDW